MNMNWGTRIVVTFIAFVGVIITMVVISMKQDIHLVAKDYYVQELAYQDQMDRISNSNELNELKPLVNYDAVNKRITLSTPDGKNLDGTIYFFRPSDARLDKKYTIQLVNGKQVFSSDDLDKGLWRVKVNWKDQDKEFYTEKVLIL
ncbi:MAG: FixH family protein [Bacteroidota bacterium]